MCLHVSLFLESMKSDFILTPLLYFRLVFFLLNCRFQVVLQPFEKIVLTGLKDETWLSVGSEVAMT